MPQFQISTYEVSAYLQRFTGETRLSRVLKMTGPVQHHGIQNRAIFAFNSRWDGVWPNPVAGHLVDGGYSGLSLVGYFPVAEFQYYYDIVRSERPVHVSYEFRESGASSGYLRRVGLGTSTEPIGEGPSESIEHMAAILSEHLNPVRGVIVPMPIAADLPASR